MESSKEQILNKIRSAKVKHNTQVELPLMQPSVFVPATEPLDLYFKAELEKISGHCHIVADNTELQASLTKLFTDKNWKQTVCLDPFCQQILEQSGIYFQSSENLPKVFEVGVSGCEFLSARTGSILISSANTSGRRLPAYSNIHVVIALYSQLLPDVEDALVAIKQKYADNLPSFISNVTGPSRTADIEKTLILGAHGPKELYVFIVKS